jgi:hypothetical protein
VSVSGAVAAIAAALTSDGADGEELAWWVWVLLGLGVGLGINALFWWGSR